MSPLTPTDISRFYSGPVPAGEAGTSVDEYVGTAAETLSGGRAVRATAAGLLAYASPVAGADAIVLGVTLGAAIVGTAVTIRTDGPLAEPAWSWAPGPVYLAAAGALTQTAPTTGALVVVGTAASATILHVRPVEPVDLV